MSTLLKALLATVAAGFVAAPAMAAASDLTGAWKLVVAVGDRSFNLDCNFNEDGAALTGICSPLGDQGAQPSPFTGKVNGATASWAYDVETGGPPMHLDYTASLRSDSEMVGAIIMGTRAVTFTATRQ